MALPMYRTVVHFNMLLMCVLKRDCNENTGELCIVYMHNYLWYMYDVSIIPTDNCVHVPIVTSSCMLYS